jgi:predicted transcriptional regulator
MKAPHAALKTLVNSRLRLEILESLEQPMRLSDLRRAVDANAPNTSSKAKDLEALGLIKRSNGDYEMTPAGHIVRKKLTVLNDTLETLHEHAEFWEKTLEALPQKLINCIHEFKGAQLIRNTREDLEIVKGEIIKMINDAEELVLVLPVRCPRVLNAASGKGEITTLDDADLHYGYLKTDKGTALFTELLDMCLLL